MVAAELSRTRAVHRQRMEAKTRTKASRILQPSNYQQETAPVRVYGNYSPPGRGHPSGPAVDMSELENHIIMNVAGVYIALHPGLLHPCCTVCVVSKRILFCCVRSHFRHLLNSFTNCIEHNTYCTAWMQQTGMEGDVDSRNVHDDVVLQLGHVNSRTRRVASTRWCVVAIHPDWCCLLLVVGGLQYPGSLGSRLSLHPLPMVCTGA